ncbi:unnamed protein product [Blepharisma stoltei]|uniref:Peroxin-5 n=1 Tax=Blepharisma stoltei TaxID=1481888 RepID=A0AAU9I9R3_9CILI|nr:unnamed protein product [Blepharisma stoltei]
MDFPNNLFGNAACSADGQMIQNPLMKAMENLMIAGQMNTIDSQFNVDLHDHFEDAWEDAGIMDPHQAELEAQWHIQQASNYQAEIEDQMQTAWENKGEQGLEEVWNMGKEEEKGELEKVWEGLTAEEEEKFETLWDMANPEYQEMLVRWGKEWEKKSSEYAFNEENPFLEENSPFEAALEKIKTGLTPEAILLLEAELHRNPENSEAWAMLGKLHAENDEDVRAIAAMKRGIAIDPYNLDLLMSLGISCTNEYEEDEALGYLKAWLENHPEYCGIQLPFSPTKDGIKAAFSNAIDKNPTDPDLFQALGVLRFLDDELIDAEHSFHDALLLRPDDAALWNRLGASIAKQGKWEEALQCYYKALELRPDYVRTWTNIGISYVNSKDYVNAARYYLCALSLNPDANHLYNFLNSTFVCMERMDLILKLEARDPLAFADEFHIITREELPRSSEWVGSFIN